MNMEDERRAVAISGRIGSGKSSLSQALAQAQGWDVVSFGRYVKAVAEEQKIGTDRELLQALGQSLIDADGADLFLQKVVAYCRPVSMVQVFDGVRHIAMIDAIRRCYGTLTVVCLHAQDQLRYDRYAARSDHPVDTQTFLAWDDHAVERGAEDVCVHADLYLDAASPIDALTRETLDELRRQGFA
jgi:dephospho-CoA kinase